MALALLLGQAQLLATAQIPEFIDFEGQRQPMLTTPLDSYFEQSGGSIDFYEIKSGRSTANRRGYIGVWRLEGDQLQLLSLHEERHGKYGPLGAKIPLTLLFESAATPRHAHWFSGIIRIPQGQRVTPVHGGFLQDYEKEVYLTIKRGKLTARRIKDNRGPEAAVAAQDMEWTARAPAPLPNDGPWVDARTIDSAKLANGQEVVTRGIRAFYRQHRLMELIVPPTVITPIVRLEIATTEEQAGWKKEGVHLEVRIRWNARESRFDLISERELAIGESIHHASFEAPARSQNNGTGTNP